MDAEADCCASAKQAFESQGLDGHREAKEAAWDRGEAIPVAQPRRSRRFQEDENQSSAEAEKPAHRAFAALPLPPQGHDQKPPFRPR